MFMNRKLRLGKFSLSGDSISSTYLHWPAHLLSNGAVSKMVTSDELVSLVYLYEGTMDSFKFGQRIIRYDTLGTMLWDTLMMPPHVNYELYDFQSTADSGVIFTGWITQNEDADAIWIKWDKQGNEIWRRILPDTNNQSYCMSIIERPNNTFLIPVVQVKDSVRNLDLVTIDQNGLSIDTLSHSIGNAYINYAIGSKDGGLLACGIVSDEWFPWKYHLKVYKFREDGSLVNDLTHRLPWRYYRWNSIEATADSGFILVGHGGNAIGNQNEQPNSVWLKIDIDGNVEWHRDYYEKPGNYICQDALENPNGTITGVGGDFPSGYILHIDSLGCNFGPCDTCGVLPVVSHLQVEDIHVLPSSILRVTMSIDSIPENTWKIWTYREDKNQNRSTSTHPTTFSLEFDTTGTYPVCLGLLNECGDYRDTCFMINVFPLAVEEKEPFKVKLFPNPATEVVQLQLQQSMPGAQLELIAVDGRILGIYDINGTHQEIATSSLSSGLYIAVIRDVQGAIVWRSTFIVQ